MARTKQTARKSTGGKAPRKQLQVKAARTFRAYMTSQQALGNAIVVGAPAKSTKASIINFENTFFGFGFDTQRTCEEFEPLVSAARTRCEISGNPIDWLAVSFSTKYDGVGMIEHGRRNLALSIVLDISGSMSTALPSSDQTEGCKLDVARRCIFAILDQLTVNDSVSIVLFNTTNIVLQRQTLVRDLDVADLKTRLRQVRSGGGTDLSGGLRAGMSELVGLEMDGLSRTLFLTDMDSSPRDEKEVMDEIRLRAKSCIYTTIVGIGVDLSVGAVQQISSVPGGKYLSVANAAEFESVVSKDFPFDTMPVAFDIKLSLNGAISFDKGYGSPELNGVDKTTEVTLSSEFASQVTEFHTIMGGVLLFRIDNRSTSPQNISTRKSAITPELIISWSNLQGIQSSKKISLTELQSTNNEIRYGSRNIRKAIALTQYVETVNNYILQDADTPHKLEVATKFTELRNWLRSEMAAVEETSLDTLNQNIVNTLDQIITIESQTQTKSVKEGMTDDDDDDDDDDDQEMPQNYRCPILHEIMKDPVMAADGHSYERLAIEEWLASGKSTSPMTSLPLISNSLIPNHALRGAIAEYLIKSASDPNIPVAVAATTAASPQTLQGASSVRTPPNRGNRGTRTKQTARKSTKVTPPARNQNKSAATQSTRKTRSSKP